MTARLPPPAPAELSPGQRDLYDQIVGGPRGRGPQAFELVDAHGRLNGPFGVMLHSPEVGAALQGVGAAIRFGSALPERVRELAVLAVAAYWHSDFERYAHEPLGRRAGLTDSQLAAVAAGDDPDLDDPAELTALRAVRALLQTGDLDDDVYAACEQAVGRQGLVDLTTLVGYYATLALQLRVFRVPTPGRPA